MKYVGSDANAGSTERGSIDPVAFARDFDGSDVLGVDFDFSDYAKPGYSITQGEDIFLDPEGYAFDKLERTTLSKARDREYMVRSDITRRFALAKGAFDVQFGCKRSASRREGNRCE